LCAIASSLKVTDALTALQAAAPGGFANASQAQLLAALKTEKKTKAAEKEELEEQGECLDKSKGKGTRGRGPAGTAGPTAPVLALAMALAHALKGASERVPEESTPRGIPGAKKQRTKKGSGQGQKGGSEDQVAGVESASVLAAAQGEPGEAAKLQMDLTAATCEGDAAAGKPAKDTKEPAIEDSLHGAKRKLGTAAEDYANLSVEGFAAQRSDLLPPPVGAKSSAMLPASGPVEPPAATAAALVRTTSCSDAASEAPDSCCCVICCVMRIAF